MPEHDYSFRSVATYRSNQVTSNPAFKKIHVLSWTNHTEKVSTLWLWNMYYMNFGLKSTSHLHISPFLCLPPWKYFPTQVWLLSDSCKILTLSRYSSPILICIRNPLWWLHYSIGLIFHPFQLYNRFGSVVTLARIIYHLDIFIWQYWFIKSILMYGNVCWIWQYKVLSIERAIREK